MRYLQDFKLLQALRLHPKRNLANGDHRRITRTVATPFKNLQSFFKKLYVFQQRTVTQSTRGFLAPNGRFHWPIVDLHATETNGLSETRTAQNSKTNRKASS